MTKDFLREHHAQLKALRAIASVEFTKGIVVLLAGCGVLSLMHRDVWGVADSLLGFLHISPDHRYAQMFLNWADDVTDTKLLVIACMAFLYSVIRFFEAYGLWRARPWAEWLAMISGGIYVPFEVFDLIHKPTIIRGGILLINLIVVAYMVYLRLYARPEKKAAIGGVAETWAD
jgi:uncharacterized membrane protein (DUF2068 family)